MPAPPYSSENGRPKSPISFILLMAACGISSVSSTWLPIGQSSFSTNSRIERLRSFKSSGSSKFRPSGLVAIAISISPPSFARNATSGSREFRAALAEERRDAFLSVVAVEDRQRTLGFRAQSGGNAFVEPDIGRVFDILHRDRRRHRELAREVARMGQHFVVRNDFVHEPIALRIIGLDEIAGEHHLQGASFADQARQALASAPT